MKIIPDLVLNKHPRDINSMSLVDASNIRLSKDNSTILSDKNLEINEIINNVIGTKSIVYILECNIELLIFIADNYETLKVYRYKEKTDTQEESISLVINNLEYHGGKLNGTFTYNIDNDLIIAISEYGDNLSVPLRIINIDKDPINGSIDNYKLPIVPEVKIPFINNINYVSGNAYKGWYYFFIRYKINDNDYTQWYNFGEPIFVDNIENNVIIKYCSFLNYTASTMSYNSEYGFCTGASDYFSNNKDICNKTIKFDVKDIDTRYNKYQIGFIVFSKTYNKCYISNDIDKNNTNYELNYRTSIENGIDDFIRNNYNYNNVHKVINYKNRLYIGNYIEDNYNDNSLQLITNKIKASIVCESFPLVNYANYDVCLFNTKTNIANQYDGENVDYKKIKITNYYNLSDNEILYIYTQNNNDNGYVLTYTEKAKNVYIGANDNNGKSKVCIYIGNISEDGNSNFIKLNSFSIHYIDNKYVYRLISDGDDYIFNNAKLYNNHSKSYEERKLKTTLIAGEIYNFFIHYVDKYGHATNGYKITNKNNTYNTIINRGSVMTLDYEYMIMPFIFYQPEDDSEDSTLISKTYFAGVPINESINIDKVIIGNGVQYENYTDLGGNVGKGLIVNVINDSVKKFFYNKYVQFENKFTWDQIYNSDKEISYINIPTDDIDFNIYVNKNGDKLFKVPFPKHSVYEVVNMYPKFTNIEIPSGYIGYYISYEKFEPSRRTTGMLTRSDFRNQNKINTISIDNSNNKKSNKINYFTDDFDIDDSIKLDYNLMMIDGINVWDTNDIPPNILLLASNNYKFPHDLNKANINDWGGFDTKWYNISDYKLNVANSSVDGRVGLGTCLELKDEWNLFEDKEQDINSLYRCSLYNYSKDIYCNDNKELIRIGDIQYNTNNNGYVIKTGLNGHWTYSGFIVYNNDTVTFDNTTNTVKRIDDNTEYRKSVDITNDSTDLGNFYKYATPMLAYVQLLICDTKFHEAKHFNNEPKPVVYKVSNATNDSTAKFARGCFVEPQNTIDLFKNNHDSSDYFNPNIYTNYKNDIVNKTIYTKTIRRSNVLQDESRTIAWRTFPIEAYKNITENKGDITNIIGIGSIILVHTQHSMFVFDVNNTLETVDKTIQLTQPDSFEVAYKEVFTNELGYGGLQDENSFIVGEYGYIFYSNDDNRFYRYDENKLVPIDNHIIDYLNINKPTNVIFGEDKDNNRIIISYKTNTTKTISYNYATNTFISFHDYKPTRLYNTKNKLYIVFIEKKFTEEGIIDKYAIRQYTNNINKATTNHVRISIIITENYLTNKFINSIKYKINRINNEINSASTSHPVEGVICHFPALELNIKSNETNTGNIDISLPNTNNVYDYNKFNDYKKPYFDRGAWNFNYIFNGIADSNFTGEHSRVYGNYFIVSFLLNKDNNDTVEFEDIDFNITTI